jgi:hypothetical protein
MIRSTPSENENVFFVSDVKEKMSRENDGTNGHDKIPRTELNYSPVAYRDTFARH